MFLAGLSLFAFAAVAVSIVLLYLQEFLLRYDLTEATAIWPLFIWLSNLLFTSLLLLSLLSYYHGPRKSPVVIGLPSILLLLGCMNGFWGLSRFNVYWRGGKILVYYLDKQAELINSILIILAIAGSFYLTSSSFLETKEDRDLWLTVALLIALLGFFIPRTEAWSITDPVTVKILGFLVYYSFLGFFMIAWLYPKPFAVKTKQIIAKITPTSFKDNFLDQLPFLIYHKKKIQTLLIISTIGVVLTIFGPRLFEGSVKIYLTAAQAVEEGQAFFLGIVNGQQVFFHTIGTVVPLLVTAVLIIFALVRETPWRSVFSYGLSLFISQVLLSIFFNHVLNLERVNYEANSPFILGFILPPLIITVLVSFFDPMEDETISFFEKVRLKCMPEVVYGCTVLSTIMFDTFLFNSPTGKILVGGGSITDGIFVLPILNVFLILFTYSLISLIMEVIFSNKKENQGEQPNLRCS
ncbi:MAG: hypothetical protein ACFFFG_07460 [Candidatus Thorarchaeota archaeon]